MWDESAITMQRLENEKKKAKKMERIVTQAQVEKAKDTVPKGSRITKIKIVYYKKWHHSDKFKEGMEITYIYNGETFRATVGI